MSAKPRDLTKTRPWRTGEVLTHVALKTGQANGQSVLWGDAPVVGTTNTQVGVSAGEVTLAGAIVTHAAITSQAVPAGTATDASTFRKVLLERDAAGALTFVVGAGAVDQASAVLPLGLADRISVGWLEIPASFVVGTTVITTGMCKAMAYNAG